MSNSKPLPPGPRGGGIGLFIKRVQDNLGMMRRLHDDYGEIVSLRILGRPMCLVFSPDMIQQVMVKQRDRFEKGPAYKRTNFLNGPTLLTGDGDDHRRRRKLAQPAFHRKALNGYAQIMLDETIALQGAWSEGQSVDLMKELHRLTLNIATKAFFGSDTTVSPQLVNETLKAMDWGLKMSLLPCGKQLMKIPLPQNLRSKRVFAEMDRAIASITKGARDESQDRSDLISLLVRAKDEDGVEPSLSDEEVRDEAYVILMAGHETTANALTWAFYFLSKNPDALQRLEAEVDSVLGGRAPAVEDFEKLVFTKAVFHEAIRLCPPIYFVGRTALEDVELGDYRVPKGTVVQVCMNVVQHSDAHFSDPEEFRPERWLTDDPKQRHKFSFIPFGGGARICIGEGFSTMEVVFALVVFVQRWRFRLDPDYVLTEDTLSIHRVGNGLPVRVEKR